MMVNIVWVGGNIQGEWEPCDMVTFQILALSSTPIRKPGLNVSISQAKLLISCKMLKLLIPLSPTSHCSLEEGTSL